MISETVIYPHVVYIGLGSNLEQPIQQIQQALVTLTQIPQTILRQHSGLYRSKPLNNMSQPDYINAVAELHTALPPLALLQQLQQIETQQGRVRGERWGARTLELDMLLYDKQQLTDPHLTLPHPAMLQRAFVLFPLYECNPNLLLPNGLALSDVITHSIADDLIRINDATDSDATA
ncbi:MAG: 2-amino-4-hydroxy-6-hydroxymethyldihydropteridine diphosphokinase [Thiotrichaceae bacterium]